jgi:hypothetical protein
MQLEVSGRGNRTAVGRGTSRGKRVHERGPVGRTRADWVKKNYCLEIQESDRISSKVVFDIRKPH